MIKSRSPRRSLSVQMIYMAAAGLAAALVMFLIVSFCGDFLVRKIYMSESAVNKRKTELYTEFTSYVTNSSISGSDSASIARFTAKHPYASVIVFGRDSRYYHFSGGESNTGNVSSLYDSRDLGRLFAVRFRDGVYQVAILDESDTGRYHMVRLLGIMFAGLSFLAVSFLFSSGLSKRVIRLSHEAKLVSSGELQREITAEGGDEISDLAASMDEMRRSVIDRMGKERQAWEANSQLITAISHDIRTPMTSVIGYLGLLSESDLSDSEHCRQYVDTAYSKAMELKYLTDELFRYFLVFGKAELDMNMEKLNAGMLLEQLTGEAEFDIRDAGFTVEHRDFTGEVYVQADAMYLSRVMNNVVSNIKKYADPALPVSFVSGLSEGRLTLTVTNAVDTSAEQKESTNIGLMTCKKIMEHMGGAFEAKAEGYMFVSVISLPAEGC